MVRTTRWPPTPRRLRLRPWTVPVSLALLFALCSSAAGQGWPPSSGQRAQPPAQTYAPWQFRPIEPNNARGQPQQQLPQPRAYGNQYPGGRPPWGQGFPGQQRERAQYPAGPYGPRQYAPGYRGQAMAQPELEVTLTDDMPYVQENVLLRLEVISSGNLETASPILSGYSDVLLEQVQGPKTTTRSSETGPQIVNEFIAVLTPLRPGSIEVGPLRVTGTLAGGAPFEAETRAPLRLQVRPAMASVRPWLPLENLTLTRDLDTESGIEEGRPVTLTLEMTGAGAVGEQLPSLAQGLESEDFRVYREQTLTDTRLDGDGPRLVGQRTEYYTLVPHSGGRLHLPEIRIDWWNVETARRETSGVPIRTVSVSGKSGMFGFTRSTERNSAGPWSWVWMPLAGIGLLLLGYWGGVWLRSIRPARASDALPVGPPGPRLRQALRSGARSTLLIVRKALTRLGRRIDPRAWLAKGRELLIRLTPKSTRVYHCATAARHAPSPAAWAAAFQSHACHQLRTRSREPLPRLADRIIDLRPGADVERVRALMQQLDTALYNGQQLDFARWKRDFQRALRPGSGGLRSLLASRVRRGRLPALNPRPVP